MGAGAGASGCRQIADVHVRQSARAECAACFDSWCAAEESACRAAPSCSERLDCEDACDRTDGACLAMCRAKPAAASTVTANASACHAAACGGPCAASCGDIL